MKECNQEENRKKVELAITEIKRMETEGKKISVSELSKNTGFSKAFFYKNEDVRSVLDASTEQQREKNFVAIKEEVKRMSLERQVEYYEKKIKELIRENEILQAENATPSIFFHFFIVIFLLFPTFHWHIAPFVIY